MLGPSQGSTILAALEGATLPFIKLDFGFLQASSLVFLRDPNGLNAEDSIVHVIHCTQKGAQNEKAYIITNTTFEVHLRSMML